jgi:drug/metabolite transporter (DMT)-like permease
MFSSALSFTAHSIVIKLMGSKFSVWDIAFYRFFGGMVLLIAIFGRHKNPFKGHNIRLLVIRGCTGSITFLCLIAAIRLLPVSTAIVIFYCFPAFAAVFSFLIYKESLSKFEIVCIAVVLLGVMVLFDFKLEGGLLGKALGLLAGVFAGMTITFIKELRAKNDPAIIYLYFCVIGSLVTFPVFIVKPQIPVTPVEWFLCAGLILFALAGQLLMNQGFLYCKSWEGGLFLSSEVIFTTLVGVVFLHDLVTWRFWIGSLLIIGSVMLLNLGNMKGSVKVKSTRTF